MKLIALAAVAFTQGQAPEPVPADTMELQWATSEHADEAFFRPVAAIVSQKDEVWVLDGGNSAAYLFSLDGEPTRVVGRRGGGPGEYVSPSLLVERPDTVVIWDRRQQRATFLDVDGEFLTSFEIPVVPTQQGFARAIRIVGDSAWVFTDNFPGPDARDNESQSEIWAFTRGRLEGDRLFTVPGREIRVKRLSSGMSRHPAPFGRVPYVSFLPDGGFLYGTSRHNTFLRFDSDMSVVDTLTLVLPRLEVLPDEREAFSDSMRQALEAGFARAGVGPTYRDQFRKEMEPFIDGIQFPELHEAFLLAKVIEGELWLNLPARAESGYHELRSFSLEDGAPHRRQFLPAWGTLIEFDVSPHGVVALEISRDTDERRVAMFRSNSTNPRRSQ